MTKDEYIEKMTKYMADYDLEREVGLTYLDGIQEAADLARQLDEPKKVIIPQFVADWIEKAKLYYGDEVDPLRIIDWIDDYVSSMGPHYEWAYNIDNQKLLLNAIANGYEVEKEPKYLVKIKGFDGFDYTKYVNYRMPENVFLLNSSIESEVYKTNFTKQWLKDHWSEYDAYNNAGLLEFEEVEDD